MAVTPTLRWPLPNQWCEVSLAWNAPHMDAYGNIGKHAGFDLSLTKTGIPIYAPTTGVVTARHDLNDGPAGLWLMVQIILGGVTWYWNVQHLLKSYAWVQPGVTVQRGQVLAWTGDSGYEDGLCLHTGLARTSVLGSYADNSMTVDPMPYYMTPPGLAYALGSGHTS